MNEGNFNIGNYIAQINTNLAKTYSLPTINHSFEEGRRKGIGGSDIAAILNLNPYKSAFEVYLEKVEGYRQDLSTNQNVQRGIKYENEVARRYQERTSKEVLASGQCNHAIYPFLIANPDGLIKDEMKGVEFKTVGRHAAINWGSEESKLIPEYYFLQIHHYMLVLDYMEWDVAALFADTDELWNEGVNNYELRIYTFHRDKRIDDIILEHAINFWQNHVERKIPPAIDFERPDAPSLIKALYNRIEKKTVYLSEEFMHYAHKMKQAKQSIKKWQEVYDENQALILNEMGNAEIAFLEDGSSLHRKAITSKEYTVKAKEYIRLDFKENKGVQNDRK